MSILLGLGGSLLSVTLNPVVAVVVGLIIALSLLAGKLIDTHLGQPNRIN